MSTDLDSGGLSGLAGCLPRISLGPEGHVPLPVWKRLSVAGGSPLGQMHARSPPRSGLLKLPFVTESSADEVSPVEAQYVNG